MTNPLLLKLHFRSYVVVSACFSSTPIPRTTVVNLVIIDDELHQNTQIFGSVLLIETFVPKLYGVLQSCCGGSGGSGGGGSCEQRLNK
jgi:hypothetical protein